MNRFRREAATESSPGRQGLLPNAAERRERIAQRVSAGSMCAQRKDLKGRQGLQVPPFQGSRRD